MKSPNPLQLTLAIIKPHVIKSPFALQKIREIIVDNDFKVVRSRRTKITSAEASYFYQDHKDKFFYNRLVTFMCSGASDVHILARDNAIVRWRELMGPTKVYQAQYLSPESIRGKYGLSDTRNATHGSDSPDSVIREIKVFFNDFDVNKWYDTEEIYFNRGQVKFYPDLFLHKIDKSSPLN
ncbi:nucleoside diphosphate kinase 6 [Microplitis demolitor]|uniref:nucleoside diphosphate kinase 6 n=1 Tax=Microplitis demolitor TaxID=69319 RepID=UPI0004CD540B|nr:nucleoside diphosphate kinase 6 [Microplitis demolitor]